MKSSVGRIGSSSCWAKFADSVELDIEGKYNIIYADPPWLFRDWSGRTHNKVDAANNSRNRRPPYRCMTTEQICSLPVERISAPDCVLFLWCINPLLPDAFEVIQAWGFTYKTVGFVWVKTNPSGRGFLFGLGYWTRSNPELCLLATHGHPRRISRSVSNLVVTARSVHSRKPDDVRNRIVELCGNVPRIELFARENADGWSAWGDEVGLLVSSEPNVA